MKRILVPLDRSAAAEHVLGVVADLARSAGASVRLIHVTDMRDNVVSEGRVVAYADQEMDRIEAEASAYLRSLAATHLAGVPTDCVVRFGRVVSQIRTEIDAFGADVLVVMTKTRWSLTRALLGSVAEELLHEAPIAVVLVRPALCSRAVRDAAPPPPSWRSCSSRAASARTVRAARGSSRGTIRTPRTATPTSASATPCCIARRRCRPSSSTRPACGSAGTGGRASGPRRRRRRALDDD